MDNGKRKSNIAMRPDQYVDTGAAHDQKERAFDEWTAKVMAGIKRMENDPEHRAKIDAISAAASPKTTMLNPNS